MTSTPRTRVLVVDDSAIVRKVLSSILDAEPDMEVVGTAPDPYVARDKILALEPDILTLDIEMPRMDGLTFLNRIMRHHPMPVIVISSLAQSSTRAALEAMSCGAVDVLAKPGGPYSVGDLKKDLPQRIRAAAHARVARHGEWTGHDAPAATPATAAAAPAPRGASGGHIIAIGASTGGTQAIEAILRRLPGGMPPIVIAQHIPAGFSAAFAERLDRLCRFTVREAAGGELLESGLALVAPGDHHLLVEQAGEGRWRTRLSNGPKVCYQRPSVDVLFRSVAGAAGAAATGVILTGMGGDGADGLLEMRKAGASTIAQDEATSVVYGMPREAVQKGAAGRVLPLGSIPGALLRTASSA